MILAIWRQQRKRCEPLDNLSPRLRPRKPLQQFLQDESGGDDDICSGERFLERLNFGLFALDIASECERPDARIDKEAHLRERPAL